MKQQMSVTEDSHQVVAKNLNSYAKKSICKK